MTATESVVGRPVDVVEKKLGRRSSAVVVCLLIISAVYIEYIVLIYLGGGLKMVVGILALSIQ